MSRSEYHPNRETSTFLSRAASELLAVARLEFLADPHSLDGIFLAGVGLLVLRMSVGSPVDPDAWLRLRRISEFLEEQIGRKE